VLAIVGIAVMYPNVARAGIEERGFTVAIRELDTAKVSRRLGSRGLKDWFQCDRHKNQKDEREDRLRVKVNTHVSASK
jgi:6-phosphogluconate dehydrogenase